MKIYKLDKDRKLKIISASELSKELSSDLPQFSETRTELNDLFDEFTVLLDSVALSLSEITNEYHLSQITTSPTEVAASLTTKFISSKVDLIKNRVFSTHSKIDEIRAYIATGALMRRIDYIESKDTVNDSSQFVENQINRASTRINISPDDKAVYYDMVEVTLAFKDLVVKFNKTAKEYGDLHNITLPSARIDFKFFKLKKDVLNNRNK